MIKNCFKCNIEKSLTEFYKHPWTTDGRLGKCKECAKIDCKTSNGTQKRCCVICNSYFKTTLTEVKRGGGNCCSRDCWYKHFNSIVRKGEDSPNWKGGDVGINALHDWVKRKLGTPSNCEYCLTQEDRKYEWSNISQLYKRELSDRQRLCVPCHSSYDRRHPLSNWNKTKQKHA